MGIKFIDYLFVQVLDGGRLVVRLTHVLYLVNAGDIILERFVATACYDYDSFLLPVFHLLLVRKVIFARV